MRNQDVSHMTWTQNQTVSPTNRDLQIEDLEKAFDKHCFCFGSACSSKVREQ